MAHNPNENADVEIREDELQHEPKYQPSESDRRLDACMEVLMNNLEGLPLGGDTKPTIQELAESREKARMLKRRVFWYGILLSILAGLIYGGYWINQNWYATLFAKTKYATDTRPCSLVIGEKEITGSRTYSYRYSEHYGIRFIDTKEIKEETRIDVAGAPMTIIGMTGDDEPQTVVIGQGEKYRQLLKAADKYVFVLDGGKTNAVVSYQKLCK